MSLIDKVVAAVTPQASESERQQARQRARGIAGSGWLARVIEHHERIEQAFTEVRTAASASQRRLAQKQLGELLTGHSLAEEAVLYPAMALTGQKGHSGTAYSQQSDAKVEAAALESLDAASQDFLEKLEHLRAAVAHHIHEEESLWFPQLMSEIDTAMKRRLTTRYEEEFQRYMGLNAAAT